MISFKYFLAPSEEMSGFVAGPVTCAFCGSMSEGFALDSATCRLPDGDGDGKHGCPSCLQAGQFEFAHDTDIGVLDEDGLEHVYGYTAEPPANFPAHALVELRRTPRIVTWQQEPWLTHCNDFMAYVGTWEPSDFTSSAQDGDGRALFLRMTRDAELHELWDASLGPGEAVPSGWHATYYVFRCLHCSAHAGNWDCD